MREEQFSPRLRRGVNGYDFVDPDGAGPLSVALATRYLNGPGNAGATDQVFAQEDASTGNVLWLLADNLGTTRDVVDNSSTLAAHFVYNSFGQLASGPTNVTPFLYTGQMWDADVGLQYNWHRWYDPAVGRWISEDPTVFRAGDVDLSRYADNSPTSKTDRSGLAAQDVIAQQMQLAMADQKAQVQKERKKIGQGLILEKLKIDKAWKVISEGTKEFFQNLFTGKNLENLFMFGVNGLSNLGEMIARLKDGLAEIPGVFAIGNGIQNAWMKSKLKLQIGVLSNLQNEVTGFVGGYFSGEREVFNDWEKMRDLLEEFNSSSQK